MYYVSLIVYEVVADCGTALHVCLLQRMSLTHDLFFENNMISENAATFHIVLDSRAAMDIAQDACLRCDSVFCIEATY